MANDLELCLNEAVTTCDYEVALSCVYDLLTQVEMEMEDESLSPAERAELESKAFALYSQSIDLRALAEDGHADWGFVDEFDVA